MRNANENGLPGIDPASEPTVPIYEIRVKGCMDEMFWSDWFGGFTAQIDPSKGETCLHGPIADQAELYGLLARLRNKGLTLISFRQVKQGADSNGE